MAKRNRQADSSQAAQAQIKGTVGLDDLIQEGARQIVEQAVEAELKALLERYSNVKTRDGRQAVVRTGYLPARRHHGNWACIRSGSEGARPLGLGREVQSGDRAAVRAQIAARVIGTAVVVSGEASSTRRCT